MEMERTPGSLEDGNSPVDLARQWQEAMRSWVRVEKLDTATLSHVTGVDASYAGGQVFAAAVTVDYASGQVVEQAVAVAPVTFPYLPGWLALREAPAILQAVARLERPPDVLIVDGHGLAHPRRFGIACHVGVLLDRPSIGCAKSLLVGGAEALPDEAGSRVEIRLEGERLGMALRTRRGVKPVFVSVGHRVDLDTAVEVVLGACRGLRLPEPARLAHQLANRQARAWQAGIHDHRSGW